MGAELSICKALRTSPRRKTAITASSKRAPSVLGLRVQEALEAFSNALGFLKRYVAGGVSLALEKTKTPVRPLACGDPIRRLVAKCFCFGGKEEISKAFAGRNYGVGSPGGVEVVSR